MQKKLNISKKLQKIINQELEIDESIQWIDQPAPSLFTLSPIEMILFGIPFALVSLLLITYLFGIPLLIAYLYVILTAFRLWKEAKNTIYLVTDKRAICIEGGRSTNTSIYLPHQLQRIYRKERSDGTGDVIIAIHRDKDSDGDEKIKEVGFMGIRNPQEVEKILKQLANEN